MTEPLTLRRWPVLCHVLTPSRANGPFQSVEPFSRWALASAIVFSTRSGRLKGSRRAATHAGPITRAWMTYCAVRLRKRSCRRGIGYGLPLAERLGESIERKAGPFVGQGIRAPYKEDWAVRVVFEGEEVYSSLAKDFTNFLNRELVKHPFLRRDIVPRQHVCSLVYLPGTCVAFSERRLFWAHTRRSFASVQSRFETRPPWWFMYDTTDLLSERTSTRWPVGRIDRPDILLAFLGSWCAGSNPPWKKGSFFQQIHHLCAEDMSVVAARLGGEHTVEVREKKTFSLHPAFREVWRDNERPFERCMVAVLVGFFMVWLRVLVVSETRALLLLPGWSGRLLRHWIQGNLGPGSLALREVVASCRAWAPSISPLFRKSGLRGGWRWFWLSAESAQIWGDWKQKKSWCVWRRSVASLKTTSEPPWNVQRSPPQLVQTGYLTRLERRGKEFYPPLSSPSSWARGGTPTRWGWT